MAREGTALGCFSGIMAFRKKDKIAAAIYQDVETKGMEADHIQPKSKGGSDDITNLQWLSRKANRMKSNKTIPRLHDWQREFLDAWIKHTSKSFLLIATPGSGKTIAALVAAKKFLDESNAHRLLIIGPSTNLKGQWCDAAKPFGIHLQMEEFLQTWKTDFIGGISTYQGLGSQAPMWARMIATHPTMVILDEPHHCCDRQSWGANALMAFDGAERLLLLTGTAFRTDRQRIPFVNYNDDRICVPDYRFGYQEALSQGIIRPIKFDYAKGNVTFVNLETQEEQVHEFNCSQDDIEASLRLRALLNGDYCESIIREAHVQLMATRSDVPDAAAMAVCMDQSHADRISGIIASVTGAKPVVVISDDKDSHKKIKAFRDSSEPWIVSVRQISEGTDIPRLQVGAYLTNVTTRLFFEQLCGRYQRRRRDMQDMDHTAFMMLPSDPRLVQHARDIELAQMEAVEIDIEQDADSNCGPSSDRTISKWASIGSEFLGFEQTIIKGQQYTQSDNGTIKLVMDHFKCAADSAADFFEKLRHHQSNDRSTQEPKATEESDWTRQEQLNFWRGKSNDIAWAYSQKIGADVRDIHNKFKKHNQMSIHEAKDKWVTIKGWFRNIDNE